MQNLSKRLMEIAVLVPRNCRVADIGTDHGYLPIYLAENRLVSNVIACDIGEKPLAAAKKNIDASGLNNICTRLSDGFESITPDEIDAAVIAGIGGEVISGILSRCSWLKNSRYTLILQPTTSPEKLREFLSLNSFEVEYEKAVCENGKIYSVMLARYSGRHILLDPHELYIGNLTPENEDNRAYLEKQLKRIQTLANDLKNVQGKESDHLYYLEVARHISDIIGGKNGA